MNEERNFFLNGDMNLSPVTLMISQNITGDIEESVLSLDETIEPYLSEYKKKEPK